MKHPSLLGIIIPLLLFFLTAPTFTWANTEKAIFTVNHSAQKPSDNTQTHASRQYHGIIDPSSWKTMTSPYTIIRAEKILPSFYENDVTIASQRARRSFGLSTDINNNNSQLINEQAYGVDLQNRQFLWYVLKDLDHKTSFELRISYPATSPADFDISVWTLTEAQERLPISVNLLDHFPENTMFARIKATYTGVSYVSSGNTPSPETLPVPFNLVLERLYLLVPYQALKLAAVIVVVAVSGLGYVVPRVYRALVDIASEGFSLKKVD